MTHELSIVGVVVRRPSMLERVVGRRRLRPSLQCTCGERGECDIVIGHGRPNLVELACGGRLPVGDGKLRIPRELITFE